MVSTRVRKKPRVSAILKESDSLEWFRDRLHSTSLITPD
jgi:hypothetical protein